MNDHAAFERLIADRFAEMDRAVPSEQSVNEILTEARRMRPLPRWIATIKEPPMRVSSRVAVGSPIARLASLVIVVLVLSVLLAASVAVGATLITSPAPSSPPALVVALDGTGDFTTIAEAIAAAQDGDTVRVRPGTYAESITISKRIVLIGDGPLGSVVIAFSSRGPTLPSVLGGDVRFGVALDHSNAVVSNLTVRGPEGAGVWINGGEPTLAGLTVEFPSDGSHGIPMAFEFGGATTARLSDATGAGMIAIGGGASPTITRLVQEAGAFVNGTGTKPHISDSKFGFALDIQDAAPTLERNDLLGLKIISGAAVIRDNIIGNPLFVAGGIHESSEEVTGIEITGGTPLIDGNRIGDHEVGISVDRGSAPIIQGNTIEANATGVLLFDSFTTPVLSGNSFCGNATNLRVPAGSAVTLDGNSVCGASPSSTP